MDNRLSIDLDIISVYCKNIFIQLNSKNILITGASGFIGKWFIDSILYANKKYNLNIHIYALSRDPYKFININLYLKSESNITFIQGDILDFKFPSEKIHHVIHLATSSSQIYATLNPVESLSTIIDGTNRILNLAKKHDVISILFISSGAVYGNFTNPVNEDYLGAPDISKINSIYGEGKRLAELYCYISDCNVKIARCFTFIGPGLPTNSNFAAANFINDSILNGEIKINSTGHSVRSYMYVSDLIIWLFNIMQNGIIKRSYNVGSDISISIQEFANLIAKMNGNSKVIIEGKDTSFSYYVPSIKRSQSELNLKIMTSLENSIIKTLRWFKENDSY